MRTKSEGSASLCLGTQVVDSCLQLPTLPSVYSESYEDLAASWTDQVLLLSVYHSPKSVQLNLEVSLSMKIELGELLEPPEVLGAFEVGPTTCLVAHIW